VRRDLEHLCVFLQRSEKIKYLPSIIGERANRAAGPLLWRHGLRGVRAEKLGEVTPCSWIQTRKANTKTRGWHSQGSQEPGPWAVRSADPRRWARGAAAGCCLGWAAAPGEHGAGAGREQCSTAHGSQKE